MLKQADRLQTRNRRGESRQRNEKARDRQRRRARPNRGSARKEHRPTLPSFQKLLVVRRCVQERMIEATAPLRGVHKSEEIFLDIDRLEEQAFVTNLLGVFDQTSRGAIDALCE